MIASVKPALIKRRTTTYGYVC